jgi:hypothetical protein
MEVIEARTCGEIEAGKLECIEQIQKIFWAHVGK